MKKISIYSYTMFCAMIVSTVTPSGYASDATAEKALTKFGYGATAPYATAPDTMPMRTDLLRTMSQSQDSAVTAPNPTADKADAKWDSIIDYLQGCIANARKLQVAQANTETHKVVASQVKEALKPIASGKTKNKAADYKVEAEKANTQIDNAANRMHNLAKTINETASTAVTNAKDSFEKVTQAHDDTQTAAANEDAKNASDTVAPMVSKKRLSKQNLANKETLERADKKAAEKAAKEAAKKHKKAIAA